VVRHLAPPVGKEGGEEKIQVTPFSEVSLNVVYGHCVCSCRHSERKPNFVPGVIEKSGGGLTSCSVIGGYGIRGVVFVFLVAGAWGEESTGRRVPSSARKLLLGMVTGKEKILEWLMNGEGIVHFARNDKGKWRDVFFI